MVNAAKDVGIPLLGENALEGGIYNPEVRRSRHWHRSMAPGTNRSHVYPLCGTPRPQNLGIILVELKWPPACS